MHFKTITFLFALAFLASCTNKTETAAGKTNDQTTTEETTTVTTTVGTTVEDNTTTERNEVSPIDAKAHASTPEKLTVKPPKKIKTLGAELTGKKWLMSELVSKSIKGKKKVYYIEFMMDNTFIAFAGCNSFHGSYKLKGENISFGDVITTKMACEDMKDENSLMEVLRDADQYRIENGQLLILDGKSTAAKFK